MSQPADPEDVVTLTRIGELTAAQLLRGRLEAEGIECFIPDEHMATQTWHLQGAIGGIRVQVRRADLEQAQQVLAQAGVELVAQDGGTPGMAGSVAGDGAGEGDDGTISAGDRAAFRSLRVSLVSLWLMGLVHPYSFWLSVRALGAKDLTAWGRRRAAIALLVSLAGCVWMVLLVLRFVALARRPA